MARDGAALRAVLTRARPVYEAQPGGALRLRQRSHRPERHVAEIRPASAEVGAAEERRLSDDPQMQALIAEARGLIADRSVTTVDGITAAIGHRTT